MATPTVKTLTIDNFSGEITPDMIGSLNSGQCPLALSPWGKLPFGRYKNKGLQFIDTNVTIGSFSGTGAITVGFRANNGSDPIVFCVDTKGNAYNILVADVDVPTPDAETISRYTSQGAGTPVIGDTLNFGGSVFYDASSQVIVVGTDGGAYYSSANPLVNPTTATFTGVSASTAFTASTPRPTCFFLGSLYIADGNNLRKLNSTYTTLLTPAVGNSELNPTLPAGWRIRDLKVSPDGTYMIILASQASTTNDFNISTGQQPQFQPIDSVIAYWNGSDAALTSLQYFRGLNIVSLGISSTDAVMFAKDADGTGIFDLNGNRLTSIADVSENGESNSYRSYPPSPYSVDAIGKKFFFLMQVGAALLVYMFDLETNKLYSLYQDSSTDVSTGNIAGFLTIASIASDSVINNAWALTTNTKLYYFFKTLQDAKCHGYFTHLANYGGNFVGAYSTQFQEFERKIRPVAVRVFCYPTVASNSFIVRLQDIAQNYLFNQTYTYAAGSDLTKAQGALTKIEWLVKSKAVSELGLQVVPNVSSPFFINKVEIDYLEDLNPSNS